jgi:hypothetical protein
VLPDLPLGPAFQYLLAQPAHLLDHPALRLIGGAQVVPDILNQVDQTFDPVPQMCMPVQPHQQPLVFGGGAAECSYATLFLADGCRYISSHQF